MLFFRHSAQNSLDNRQVNYARFAQSDEKIGGASAVLSLCGIALNFLHPYIDRRYTYWYANIYKEGNTIEQIYNFSLSGDIRFSRFKLYLTKGQYYLKITSANHSNSTYTFNISTPENNKPEKLNKTSLSLGKGEAMSIIASGGFGGYKWRTSDSKIATVDQKGVVRAVGNGTAWVTAKWNNGIERSCKVTVKNAPSKVTLTKGIVTIGVGESFSLDSGVNSGAASANRTYRSSNSNIVKMTKTTWTGVFKGVAPGVAYVTVRTYNHKESTCKVTVKAAPTSVTISKKNLTMKVGQTATLSCSVPSNAGCATRTYRTSNSAVVIMTKTNWTGKFKAMKPGTAYVTVRTYNGKESTCKVTVVK